MSFLRLPARLQVQCLLFLDAQDVARVSATCAQCAQLETTATTAMASLWQHLYRRRWLHHSMSFVSAPKAMYHQRVATQRNFQLCKWTRRVRVLHAHAATTVASMCVCPAAAGTQEEGGRRGELLALIVGLPPRLLLLDTHVWQIVAQREIECLRFLSHSPLHLTYCSQSAADGVMEYLLCPTLTNVLVWSLPDLRPCPALKLAFQFTNIEHGACHVNKKWFVVRHCWDVNVWRTADLGTETARPAVVINLLELVIENDGTTVRGTRSCTCESDLHDDFLCCSISYTPAAFKRRGETCREIVIVSLIHQPAPAIVQRLQHTSRLDGVLFLRDEQTGTRLLAVTGANIFEHDVKVELFPCCPRQSENPLHNWLQPARTLGWCAFEDSVALDDGCSPRLVASATNRTVFVSVRESNYLFALNTVDWSSVKVKLEYTARLQGVNFMAAGDQKLFYTDHADDVVHCLDFTPTPEAPQPGLPISRSAECVTFPPWTGPE